MRKIFNNNGLTLIEIIITLAVLGVVITPLMSMFITSQKINNESEMKYNAIQLAQKYMEGIKAVETLDVTSSGYTGSPGNYSKTIYDYDYKLEINIKENEEITLEDVDPVVIPGTFNQTINVNVSTLKEINATQNNENIRINLSVDNGTIKVNNTFSGVKLYIFKSDKNFNYSITGNGTVIEAEEGMKKPDNILYYITVNVYKDDRLIETVSGSTVFNSIITD